MADTDIAVSWHLLEITGIVQSVLCALFGVYFSLFILALWANHGRQDISSRRLRTVTIVLFVDLCAHFIARSLQFARSRIMEPNDNEFFKWGIPLIVIGNVTTTFAGLCSDGLLAWRFYVLFEQRKWALYIPGTFVIINALLCWSADAQHLAAYTHYDFYENTLLEVTLQITVAWGWLMFAINTILTGAIITRICVIARRNGTLSIYETVIRACIESALVTWIGLLLYEICSLAPNGHVVTNYDVGYVMASVIPVFFGISQCLIVVRIALTNEFSPSRSKGSGSGSGLSGSFPRHPGLGRTPMSPASKTISFAGRASATLTSAYRDREEDDLNWKAREGEGVSVGGTEEQVFEMVSPGGARGHPYGRV